MLDVVTLFVKHDFPLPIATLTKHFSLREITRDYYDCKRNIRYIKTKVTELVAAVSSTGLTAAAKEALQFIAVLMEFHQLKPWRLALLASSLVHNECLTCSIY